MKYSHPEKFIPEKLHPLNIGVQAVNLVPGGLKVLEIGGADGFISEYLQKKKNCRVVGVEKNEEAVLKAQKRGLLMVLGDIEEEIVQEEILKLGQFDLIFSLALIEHLKDPGRVLKQWQKFLKKEGILIISTSNIAHWSARLKILSGKFEYQDYGIFDNTHLKFFTTETFKKLVSDSGYMIKYFSVDPVGGGFPKISKFLAKFFPNLFAYQMVIKGVKK